MEQKINDLTTVIDTMLSTSVTTYTPLDNSELITFKRAGIVELGMMTGFMNAILETVSINEVEALISVIAPAQAKLMYEGKSAHDMNLNAAGIVSEVLGKKSLVLTLFAATADQIPSVVQTFSTCTAQRYADMELDEQLVIIVGIFAVNYGFFTQSLRPIIKSVFAGLKRKQNETKEKIKVANAK